MSSNKSVLVTPLPSDPVRVSVSVVIVVPLSSVSLTIAYRQMVSDYKGNEHPDILHNIV